MPAALALSISAQEIVPDSLARDKIVVPDSSGKSEDIGFPDSSDIDNYSRESIFKELPSVRDETQPTESEIDTVTPAAAVDSSIYEKRLYLSRGVGDEIKSFPELFSVTPGAAGTPIIPVEYLNAAGVDIHVNGHPFIYNGIYRPYINGTDLNVLPWEILNAVKRTDRGLDFSLGIPPHSAAGSDIEISRGPYGYASSRWRFYQPLNSGTNAYFALGFKENKQFYTNTDYDGYHIAGGLKREMFGGRLDIDLWKHRARAGLLSFDFLVNQLSRQSRGLDRTEIRFERKFNIPLKLSLQGLFQRAAQTIQGYAPDLKIKYDMGGGKADFRYDTGNFSIGLVSSLYNLRLYGLDGLRPSTEIFDQRAILAAKSGHFSYNADLAYSWTEFDRGAFLPNAGMEYNFSERFFASLSFSNNRGTPDLQLLYFDDHVENLGYTDNLDSYQFASDARLKSPVSTRTSINFGSKMIGIDAGLSLSLIDIENQIRLSYQATDPGNFVVRPVNFDDRFMEAGAKLQGRVGPFAGEISTSFRKWNDRYFDDGLEKGPVVLGFGRLAFEKRFFIPDLYLGGSVEMQASSRRDYRSIRVGLTDGFAIFHGRLVFRYKDFTFYLNEDNLLAEKYYPLWPYPGTPRAVWWGFRWKFIG